VAEDGALPDCCAPPTPEAEAPAAIGAPAAAGVGAAPAVVSPELVTKFAGEYGFVNKRLPVLKLGYAGPGHPALYVEPATGRLAAAKACLSRCRTSFF